MCILTSNSSTLLNKVFFFIFGIACKILILYFICILILIFFSYNIILLFFPLYLLSPYNVQQIGFSISIQRPGTVIWNGWDGMKFTALPTCVFMGISLFTLILLIINEFIQNNYNFFGFQCEIMSMGGGGRYLKSEQ